MIEIEQSSAFDAITTTCFQLRFLWNADHWKQEIVSTGSHASIPRIWSLEGGHSNDDPARVSNPIYQQIHIDRDQAGAARALLVGQSGPHHFSAAFIVKEDPQGVVIDIDVADRCVGPMEGLAATYLVEASDAELQHGEGSTTLTWHHPDSRLIFEADPPTQIAVTEASQGSIRLQALAALDPARKTQRFRYRWKWVQAEH